MFGTAKKERVACKVSFRESWQVGTGQMAAGEVHSGAVLVKRCSQDVFRVKEQLSEKIGWYREATVHLYAVLSPLAMGAGVFLYAKPP